MKEYKIVKRDYSKNVWDTIETAEIGIYKWVSGYTPRVELRLFHDGENLYVKFEVWEKEITAIHKNMQDEVCEDSCVEFFFRAANDERYFNFETNAIGTLLLGIGAERCGREAINVNPSIFEIKASVENPEEYKDEKWTIEYKIPFSFIRNYCNFNLSDGIYANAYKCGDKTGHEHYGMWNEIESAQADFHLPQFFGRMVFE